MEWSATRKETNIVLLSVDRSLRETMPSPKIGRKLTLFDDPSMRIPHWWL
jgi:hypothetical protein